YTWTITDAGENRQLVVDWTLRLETLTHRREDLNVHSEAVAGVKARIHQYAAVITILSRAYKGQDHGNSPKLEHYSMCHHLSPICLSAPLSLLQAQVQACHLRQLDYL